LVGIEEFTDNTPLQKFPPFSLRKNYTSLGAILRIDFAEAPLCSVLASPRAASLRFPVGK
jgi:hypothetical protein